MGDDEKGFESDGDVQSGDGDNYDDKYIMIQCLFVTFLLIPALPPLPSRVPQLTCIWMSVGGRNPFTQSNLTLAASGAFKSSRTPQKVHF